MVVKSSSLIDPPIDARSSHIVWSLNKWVQTSPFSSHFSNCNLWCKSTVTIQDFFLHLLDMKSYINLAVFYFCTSKNKESGISSSSVCTAVSSIGPATGNAGAVGLESVPSRYFCKTAAVAAKWKWSLKMTQLEPSGSSFGICIKNSKSFPVDMILECIA